MFVHSIQLLKLACCLAYTFYAVTADNNEGSGKAFINNIRAEKNLRASDLTSDVIWAKEKGLSTSNEEIDYPQEDEFRVPELGEAITRVLQIIQSQEEFEDSTEELPPNLNQSNETTAMNVSEECLEVLSEFVTLLDEHEAIFIDVSESDDTEEYNLTIASTSNMTEVKTFISEVLEHKMMLIAPYDELDEVITQIAEVCPSALIQNVEEVAVNNRLLRDIISEVNLDLNIQILHEVQISFNFSCSLLFDMEDCNDKIDDIINQLKNITNGYRRIDFYTDIHNIVGSIMFAIGVIGNTVLLIVFLKHKEMRTMPNWMILNMTIADFLMLLINALNIQSYLMNGFLAFILEWCEMKIYLSHFILYANTYSIVAMNVQRSIAIFISYSCTRFSFTKNHFVFTIVSVWIISGILAIYPTLYAEISLIGCNIGHYGDDSFSTHFYTISFTFSFIIPLIAIVVSAYVTTRVLKKSVQYFSADISGLEEIKRARALSSKVVIALTLVFALSYDAGLQTEDPCDVFKKTTSCSFNKFTTSTGTLILMHTDYVQHLRKNYLQKLQTHPNSLISINSLNEDLDSISSWSQQFGLNLNACKSQAILFANRRLIPEVNDLNIPPVKLNKTIIPFSSTVKNLRVHFESNLSWDTHIKYTCKKAFSILHSLKRLYHYPSKLKQTLVQTFILPHFDYCDVLFSDLRIDSAQKLQRVHNACVRFICNVRYYDHISPSFEKLSWLRLHERRNLHSLSLLYRNMHTSSPYYLFARFHTLSRYHNINTRSQRDNTLEIPLHTSSLYSSSFTVATSRHWNSLPPEVKGCRTLKSFKSKLENYLMTSCQTNLLL
ncbi:hypothetical protein ANN_00304 [Periplaneta americana]|uniref:G-protein coupled receptors family 1 profile domain-containing protein n=1 Tax=Periplaneta americana TaxID=6978 RepID=A0ABQ8TS79_PERAM|nr:hypothetical protein ANN_00304 [Periplaneta americana]